MPLPPPAIDAIAGWAVAGCEEMSGLTWPAAAKALLALQDLGTEFERTEFMSLPPLTVPEKITAWSHLRSQRLAWPTGSAW